MKMAEELVACYCCRCYRWFYTETDEVKCCPYCGSRRVSVEYDVVVTAVGRFSGQARITW